jgi:hypothetical protein
MDSDIESLSVFEGKTVDALPPYYSFDYIIDLYEGKQPL